MQLPGARSLIIVTIIAIAFACSLVIIAGCAIPASLLTSRGTDLSAPTRLAPSKGLAGSRYQATTARKIGPARTFYSQLRNQ